MDSAIMPSHAALSSDVQLRDKNQWETTTKAGLVSINTHSLYVSVSGPPRHPTEPIIIIFPGSNAACDSWQPVVSKIQGFARILLYDRSGLGHSETGPKRDTGSVAADELTALLQVIDVPGPYILVAHSYGGCVAREFLQLHIDDVMGMVLSETGTETRCQYAEEQYRTTILGNAPLSVIRGESAFSGQRGEHKVRQDAGNGNHIRKPQILVGQNTEHQKMIEAMAKMDEELKMEQLQLSRKNKFRNVPNCGHSVHLERPEVVVEEVRWILDNMEPRTVQQTASFAKTHIRPGILKNLRRGLLLC